MAKYPYLSVIFGTIVLVLGIATWINIGRQKSPSGSADPPPPRGELQRPPEASGNFRPDSGVAETLESPAAGPAGAILTEEEIQATLLEEIHEAAISYEASELPAIEKYLLHAQPLVREAARNGILTLGAPEGAPLLRNAAALAGDPREAVALLDAADYLELPSGDLHKLLRRKKADK